MSLHKLCALGIAVFLLAHAPSQLFASPKAQCARQLAAAQIHAKTAYQMAQQGHQVMKQLKALLRLHRSMKAHARRNLRFRWKSSRTRIRNHQALYNSLRKSALLQRLYTIRTTRLASIEIKRLQQLSRQCAKAKSTNRRVRVGSIGRVGRIGTTTIRRHNVRTLGRRPAFIRSQAPRKLRVHPRAGGRAARNRGQTVGRGYGAWGRKLQKLQKQSRSLQSWRP